MADRTVSVEFVARHAGFTSGVQSMKRDVTDLRGQIAQSARQNSADWERLGRSAMVAGGVMAAGLGAAVATFAGFQREMNRVGALTGAVGEEFDQLGDLAQELGRTTAFTASQAADALGFLAMAGFDANTAMEALPQTLTLAAAAGMDLARAADITSNILTGFGMETSQLGQANDALVATFTSSNTSLEQLGDAMKYAAPLASAAGVSFEETAAAIGLMGNAGIQGSMAGTSLRGALTRLLNPTGQVQGVLDRLGVTVQDTSGDILPLADIIDQLGRSGATAGDLMTLFGQRAGPAMQALLAQGAEELRAFTGDLHASGGLAEEIADRQLEGLHGALTRFRSAAEGAATALGEGLAPAISLAATVGTGMLSFFASLPGPLQTAISMTAGATSATLLLGGAFLLLTPRALAMHASFLTLTGSTTALAGAKLLLNRAASGAVVTAANLIGMITPMGLALTAAGVAAAGLIWWLSRLETEQASTGDAAETLAASTSMAYDQIGAAGEGMAQKASRAAQSFVTANADVIGQLREMEQAAAADLLFRIGFDLVQHGADPDEAMAAVERLRDNADSDIVLNFDASDLGDVETYASGAAEAIARMGDDLRWFQIGSSDLRQAMDEFGAAAGQAFNRDPVAGFADALSILIESQDALADSGADADSYMRRLIDAFVDTTGIEGFEGRIRSVDDLIGQMADGTAAVTPELQSLAQAFQDARDAGDPTEEALAALVAAMADLPDVTDEAAAAMAMAVDPTGELADELGLVADGFDQVQAASMSAVAGIDAYLDAQRAATDPVFALHRALGQVEDAHISYNEAVKRHGRDSGEAADASMEIVSALLAAEAAAIDGELSIDAFRDTIDRFAESGRIPDEVMRTLEGTLDRLTDKQGDHVAGFEDFSGALVDASGNVVALGGKMEALPDQVQTELRASDVASEVIASLGELYEALPEELRTYVEATDDASAVVAYLEGRYEDVPDEIRTDLIAHDNASRMIENVRSALGRVPRSINIALNATVTGSGALDSWARRIPQARGGVVDYYADGGLRESHVAQIAPAGAMRLWAEPETGGEAYIPLAAAKRDRSLQIWEETGRRLGVASFASGGLTSAGTYDTRHLFGMTRGASFGDAAGHLRAIVAMEAAYASMTRSIEQMEQAKRRQEIVDRRRNAETAEERRQAADDLANHDRQVQLAEQRYQIEQRIAAARANQRIAANREQFEFDQMDVDDQIADLERRMAAERRFTDEWMALNRQRMQLLDAEASAAAAAYDQQWDQLNQLLDARRRILDDIATLESRHADEVDQLRADHADEAVRAETDLARRIEEARRAAHRRQLAAADARTEQLRSAMSVDFGDDAWNWQATSIAGELDRQSDQIVEWRQAMAELIGRGLDRDVVEMLGLDRGPEALGQLQVLLRSTDDELADLNVAAGRRQQTIAEQVAQERLDGGSQLARDIADIERDLADELAEMRSEHAAERADADTELRDRLLAIEVDYHEQLTDLQDQLAAIGTDSGRSYADAIAEAIASGIPGIVAQAEKVQAALREVKAAEAAASVTGPASKYSGTMQAVADLFAARGVKIAQNGESEEARLRRIAAEVDSGARTLADVARSIDIIWKSTPSQRIPTFHTGGILPGRPHEEVPFVGLGGEGIFTTDQMAALGAGAASGAPHVVVVERTVERIPDGARLSLDVPELGGAFVATIRSEQAAHDRDVARNARDRRRQQVR